MHNISGKVRENPERHLEQMLREGNSQMRKENRKLEQIVWEMEKTREKFEIESRKNKEK